MALKQFRRASPGELCEPRAPRNFLRMNLNDLKGLGDTTGKQLLASMLSVLDTPPSLNRIRNTR
jgi:hypothetical protein